MVSDDVVTLSLGDKRYFTLSIGTRVLISDLHDKKSHRIFGEIDLVVGKKNRIPLYSANVLKIYGYVEKTNLYKDRSNNKKFKNPHVLYGIDGNFDLNVMSKGHKFATTDHCGCIEILNEKILPEYIKLILTKKKYELGFDRTLRASLENMEKLVFIDVPIDANGDFDLEKQEKIIRQHKPIFELHAKTKEIQNEIRKCRVNLDSEYKFVELPLWKLFTINRGSSYYTKKRIYGEGLVGNIPVYSSKTVDSGLLARIRKEGLDKKTDLHFENCLTWVTDGYAGTIFIRNPTNTKNEKKEEFYFVITDHCGILKPIVPNLYLPFIKRILQPIFYDTAKGYGKKELKLNQVRNLELKIPIDSKGNFDIKKQKEIEQMYDNIEKLKNDFINALEIINKQTMILN